MHAYRTSYGKETLASPLQKKTRRGYEEIWKLLATASFFPRTSPKATFHQRREIAASATVIIVSILLDISQCSRYFLRFGSKIFGFPFALDDQNRRTASICPSRLS